MTTQKSDRSMIHPWIGDGMFRDTDRPHLIMCPFAGGSSSAFRHWQEMPCSEIGLSVSLVIYPGRDQLRHLPLPITIEQLAIQLADKICQYPVQTTIKWLLGGHSMGAQVAFETCRILEHRQRPPAALIISGCQAPHLESRRQLSHLNDYDFVQALSEIGGCDKQLLNNPSLLTLFMPLLRADFQATETYLHPLPTPGTVLQTPTLLLYGRQDQEAWQDEVAAWKIWFADVDGPFAIAGDHFYPILRPRAFFTHVRNHSSLHQLMI
jgi:thioesterase component of yersiniabactin synthetase